jgi:hypothetical protein
VRQRGRFTRHEIPLGLDELEDIAILSAALRRQDIGTSTPLCATELPDGQRLQICLAPAMPHGTISLSIRRPGTEVMPIGDVTRRYDTRDWNKWKRRREARDNSELLALYDAGDIDAFFAAAVHARLTILLAGATGAGKTFPSKSLITEIDPSERIITIEDTLELIIPQPNHVRLLYSKDGLSGGPDHNQQCGGPVSARSRQSAVHGTAPGCPVGIRLYRRRDVGGLHLCRFCHRRFCQAHPTGRASPARGQALAGVSLVRLTPALCWTRWSRPYTSAGPSAAAASSTTAIAVCSTSRSNIPSGLPRRASSPRSAASATAKRSAGWHGRWPPRG